ncbi:hypothetical protein JQ579_21880 [Bradyrhizobium ottawaense]|nr:hypothetical protein [Bradyrhizobium ottawaense]
MTKGGLEDLVEDAPELERQVHTTEPLDTPDDEGGISFELWRIIKARVLTKLLTMHRTIRYGEFIGSKIKLPVDKTTPMELDILGQHEDGLFILELKVERSAERNAFSELFGYSNYIASMFALSGHKDIVNVLVANLDNKITRHAFLYDLMISDRNIIVYTPHFTDDTIDSLRLVLHVPTDEDFQHFANQLLSHDAMSCVVCSFDDLADWIDSKEDGGSLNEYTKEHLTAVSNYAAQLMEAEHLHGFCYVRKPWAEIPRHYRNSLVMCALNPFRAAGIERSNAITEQLAPEYRSTFFEFPEFGFDSRLTALAKRVIKDCLEHDTKSELELPLWSAMVVSLLEVVTTHNFAFRPTGMLREAYVSQLNALYAREARSGSAEDISILKINEITNWLRAWQFMEMCGFTNPNDPDESNNKPDQSD